MADEAKPGSLADLLSSGKKPEEKTGDAKPTPRPPSGPPPAALQKQNAAKAKAPAPPKAPPPVHLLAARKGFDGVWMKEGVEHRTTFAIKGEQVQWPNGDVHGLYNLGNGKCQLDMAGKVAFMGKFVSEDRITWDNGSIWKRIGDLVNHPAGHQAHPQARQAAPAAHAPPMAHHAPPVAHHAPPVAHHAPPVAPAKEPVVNEGLFAKIRKNYEEAYAPKQVAPPQQAQPTMWPVWHSSAAASGATAQTAAVPNTMASPTPATSSTAVPKLSPAEIEAKCRVLNGSWYKVGSTSRYRVEGSKLHWLDSGKVYSISPHGVDPQFPSCPRYVAEIENTQFACVLHKSLCGTEQLRWSNGGMWLREADLDSTQSSSSTAPATATAPNAATSASNNDGGGTTSTTPSKPTVVHGKGGEEIGKKIDQLLGQIGGMGSVGKVEGCSTLPKAPAENVGTTGKASSPPPPAPPATATPPAPAPANPLLQRMQQEAPKLQPAPVVSPVYNVQQIQGQYAAAVAAGLRPTAVLTAAQQVQMATAYQQAAVAQQVAAVQAAQHMSNLLAGKTAATANAQASRAAATVASAPVSSSPPPPKAPKPEEPKPPPTGGPPLPSAPAPPPPATSSTAGAKDSKAPATTESATDADKKAALRGSGIEDALKKLSASSKSADALMKMKEVDKELDKKEPPKAKESKDDKPKEKDAKDTKAKESKDAKDSKAKEKDKARVKASRSRSRSRSRGARKPRRGNSRSRDRKRSVKRSPKRSPKRSGKDRRGRRSPSSKSAKKNRTTRERSRSKRKKRKSKSRSGSARRSKSRSPVVPFVPRQLIGKVAPKVGTPALAPGVSKASFPAGGEPASKSAPVKRSEASAAAAAQLMERLARSTGEDDKSKQDPAPTVFENGNVQDDSDDDVPLGRWAAETTDEEDDEEFAKEAGAGEERMDDVCSRSAGDLSPTPNGKASTPNSRERGAAVEDEEEDDLEDSGPLPELSELRARFSMEPDKALRPPAAAQSDRRRDQLGSVEEAEMATMKKTEAKGIRRVNITSTKGTSVNLMAVMSFCAKFGEVVAMQLEGSGAEAKALIEFRDASSAQACVKQRESEQLHVAFCES